MSAEARKGISGRWVLAGFVALFAVVATIIVLISRDVDRRARKAQELESQLGRKVGPEDSPKHQKRLQKWKEQQKGE
jgi:hypothetical protein